MLFDARGPEIRLMLTRFAPLLPPAYKLWMRLLTCRPRLTRATCRLISKIVQTLHLRRQLQLHFTRPGGGNAPIMPPGYLHTLIIDIARDDWQYLLTIFTITIDSLRVMVHNKERKRTYI
jgi:hypothetical protein